jgi:hypothetical protein
MTRNWDQQGQPCKGGCGKICNRRGNGTGYCRICANKYLDPRSVFVTGRLSHDYGTRHNQVVKLRGKASAHECLMACGWMAQTWAQAKNTDGSYPDHYIPLCYSCHRAYDSTPEAEAKRGNTWRGKKRPAAFGSRMKELWADPEWRREMISKQKAGKARQHGR